MSLLDRKEVRGEIARRIGANLSPLSLYVGLAMLAVAGAHALFLEPPESRFGAAAFAVAGLLALIFRVALVRWRPDVRHNWLLVFVLVSLISAPLELNYWLYGSERYYLYGFVLLAGTGTIFYSRRWLSLMLFLVTVFWLLAARRHLEGTEWVDGLVALGLAMTVSMTVQAVRLRIIERSIRLTLLEERRREDLEHALAQVELASAEAVERAIRDPLTGAYNRRYLEELDFSLTKPGSLWGVLLIDLDDFKDVNDRFGHDEGDRVLQGVAHFISRHGRAEDQLVRFGGDEFLVLIDVKSEEEVELVAQRIRDCAKREAPISLSVGYAVRRPGEKLVEVIRRADEEMYRDKSRLRIVSGGQDGG